MIAIKFDKNKSLCVMASVTNVYACDKKKDLVSFLC